MAAQALVYRIADRFDTRGLFHATGRRPATACGVRRNSGSERLS